MGFCSSYYREFHNGRLLWVIVTTVSYKVKDASTLEISESPPEPGDSNIS